MTVIRHVLFVVWSVVRMGAATRNLTLVLGVLLGLLIVAFALAAQTAAPFVLYPFA
jgi:hypothetical protein